MKKNQYAMSITIGIFVGAIAALMIGNTTTAILSGVGGAGFTAWIGSLQWSKTKDFAIEVADESDVREYLEIISHLGSIIILGVGKIVKWTLLAPIKIAIALATDVNARKTVLATIAVLGIAYVYMMAALTSLLVYGDIAVLPAFFLGILPMLIIFVTLLKSLLIVCIEIPIKKGRALTPLEATKMRLPYCSSSYSNWVYDPFYVNWFYQVIEDDHGTVVSIMRMLYIRTGNALRIIAYPFVLIPWGAVALANNKTGASTLAAMILSGMHLSVAYFAGDIDTGNINFWLSLVVAIGLGVTIGKRVNMMREPAMWPLPSIKFRDQVALKRS